MRQQAGWGAEAWANISLGQLAIGFSLGLVRQPLPRGQHRDRLRELLAAQLRLAWVPGSASACASAAVSLPA